MTKKNQIRVSDPISSIFRIIIICSLLLFNVLPLVRVLIQSFQNDGGALSAEGYQLAFAYSENKKAIVHTLVSSSLSALCATVLGFVFAYCSCYVQTKAKKLFDFVALLPIISPPFSVSLATILLFGSKGLVTHTLLGIEGFSIYGFKGLLFSQTLSFFPMAYLTLKGVLSTIDPSIEEAARDMGASRFKTFTKVTLPLSLPGIGNAFLLVFIKCAADFSNPKFIAGSYSTMATQIYFQAIGDYAMQRCCALAMILLCMTMVIYLISQEFLAKRTFVTITGKATRPRTLIDEKRITIPFSIVCTLVTLLVVSMYFIIPVVSFVKLFGVDYSLTFNHYKEAFKYGKTALLGSIKLAAITTPLTGVIAMIMSFLIVRKKSKMNRWMQALGMMGMVIPGTVLGYAFILEFNTPPFLLTGTLLIMVASCVSRYLPVGLTGGITSLKQIDPSIEESASNLGANSAQVFTKVTIPLIKNAFFGGLVYTFVRTMTSMSALIFLVTAKRKLMTITIMDMVSDGRYGEATAMGTMMIVVVLVAIGLLYFITGLFGVNRKEVKLL